MASRLPVMPPMSYARIERKAVEFLQGHQPDVLYGLMSTDVECLFEISLPALIPGLRTGYEDLQGYEPGIEGITRAGDSKICYVEKRLVDAEGEAARRRLRSTIAHEIGHSLLHLDDKHFVSKQSGGVQFHRVEASEIPTCQNPEWQAWAFAGSLLIPKVAYDAALERGIDTEDLLCGFFDVNRAFLRVRQRAIPKI